MTWLWNLFQRLFLPWQHPLKCSTYSLQNQSHPVKDPAHSQRDSRLQPGAGLNRINSSTEVKGAFLKKLPFQNFLLPVEALTVMSFSPSPFLTHPNQVTIWQIRRSTAIRLLSASMDGNTGGAQTSSFHGIPDISQTGRCPWCGDSPWLC